MLSGKMVRTVAKSLSPIPTLIPIRTRTLIQIPILIPIRILIQTQILILILIQIQTPTRTQIQTRTRTRTPIQTPTLTRILTLSPILTLTLIPTLIPNRATITTTRIIMAMSILRMVPAIMAHHLRLTVIIATTFRVVTVVVPSVQMCRYRLTPV